MWLDPYWGHTFQIWGQIWSSCIQVKWFGEDTAQSYVTFVCHSQSHVKGHHKFKIILLPWLNLKKLYVDYKFNSNIHVALCNTVKENKHQNLNSLAIQTCASSQQTSMTELLCLDKLPNLQSLHLYNCILRGDFQTANNTLQLLEMRISSRNGFNGNICKS